MEETINLEMTKAEAEQFRSVLESGLQELRATEERMDRIESERLRLRAETRAMLDQLKAAWNVETTA
ncbi:MAG: hypothetical protein ACREEM_28460 [Blastocatellia bacterium]